MKKKLFFLNILFFTFSCSYHNITNDSAGESETVIIEKIEKPNNKKPKFLEGASDIPLAPNLTKVSDDNFDFDSVSGSITSLAYTTKDNVNDVKDFYIESLPQLGWKIVTNSDHNPLYILSFKRGKEKLEIEISNYNGEKLVKFFIEAAVK